MSFSEFFNHHRYIVNEKLAFSFQANSFAIQSETGETIGYIQEKRSTGHKVAGMFVSKNILPFHLDIIDAQGVLLLSIDRGATLMFSKITVVDPTGRVIGFINQRLAMLKHKFTIFDGNNKEIGEIIGDWVGWNFNIFAYGNQVGTINKKWAGLAKEMFTTADKYVVTIEPNESISNDYIKALIVATATTVDMVLKES